MAKTRLAAGCRACAGRKKPNRQQQNYLSNDMRGGTLISLANLQQTRRNLEFYIRTFEQFQIFRWNKELSVHVAANQSKNFYGHATMSK